MTFQGAVRVLVNAISSREIINLITAIDAEWRAGMFTSTERDLLYRLIEKCEMEMGCKNVNRPVNP